MKYNQLSPMKLKSLPAGKHGDGRGLMLVKSRREAGKWIFRYSTPGTKRRREMGLGRWPDVSLAEARAAADEARAVLRTGIDPIAKRTAAKAKQTGLTVAAAIDGCFTARQAELKGDGQAGRWLSPLQGHIIPQLGTTPIEQLDQHTLKDTIEPIWHQKPEAALKALNRVGLTLKHAAALGLDVDLQAVAKTKALLGKQRRTVRHIPSMPYQEVPAFYAWLSTQETIAALALRLLILTVARTSEVRLATEAEVEDSVWILPPERTKTGTEHRIPLTREARAVIEIAKERSDTAHLFTSIRGKPLSDM